MFYSIVLRLAAVCICIKIFMFLSKNGLNPNVSSALPAPNSWWFLISLQWFCNNGPTGGNKNPELSILTAGSGRRAGRTVLDWFWTQIY